MTHGYIQTFFLSRSFSTRFATIHTVNSYNMAKFRHTYLNLLSADDGAQGKEAFLVFRSFVALMFPIMPAYIGIISSSDMSRRFLNKCLYSSSSSSRSRRQSDEKEITIPCFSFSEPRPNFHASLHLIVQSRRAVFIGFRLLCRNQRQSNLPCTEETICLL